MGKILREKKTRKSALLVVIAIVIVTGIVGGFFLYSGDNGGSNGDGTNGGKTIQSIDFRLQGFEGGRLGGNIRYRARGIDSATPQVRIDKIGAEDALIYNGDENKYYAYTGSSWLDLPTSQGATYIGLAEWVKGFAQEGEGTYEKSYNQYSVQVKVDEIDPPLSENLFTPPENARIEELET